MHIISIGYGRLGTQVAEKRGLDPSALRIPPFDVAQGLRQSKQAPFDRLKAGRVFGASNGP